MNKLIPSLIVAALGAVMYAPVQAQDATDSSIATLQVRQGSVMHSSGGEFVGAATGARLVDGERIMVTEDSKAVVVFDNKCRHEYVDPGVYQIDREGCGAGYIANDTMATNVAVAAVLAPLLISGSDNTDPPPPPPPVSR